MCEHFTDNLDAACTLGELFLCHALAHSLASNIGTETLELRSLCLIEWHACVMIGQLGS